MKDRRYGRVLLEHRPDLDGGDEPCIVFRGQDKYAAAVVRLYARMLAAGGDAAGAAYAEESARWLEAWPVKKTPTIVSTLERVDNRTALLEAADRALGGARAWVASAASHDADAARDLDAIDAYFRSRQ